MNSYAEKIDIIQWIAGLNDKSVMQQLKKMKENSILKQQDWWLTASVAERKSIERGLIDLENGKVTPHSEVKKKYEKWL